MKSEFQNYTRTLRLVPFVNGAGEDIPPHGLIELEGDQDNGFTALKPRTDGAYCYINLSFVTIPSGKNGQATADCPAIIATNGTAAASETWGAKSGSFLANKDKPGFRAMSPGSGGMVYADRPMTTALPPVLIRGKLTGPNSYGNYAGYVQIQDGTALPHDGAECRLVMIPSTTGLSRNFKNNEYYGGWPNGTLTENSIIYPKFNCFPHHTKIINVCNPDTGVTTCDLWWIPQWLIDSNVNCTSGVPANHSQDVIAPVPFRL